MNVRVLTEPIDAAHDMPQISRVIHPDKNSHNPQATEAFQSVLLCLPGPLKLLRLAERRGVVHSGVFLSTGCAVLNRSLRIFLGQTWTQFTCL